MKKHLYILLLSISCFTINAQEKTLSSDLGYFFMGDGDYSGISYNNSLLINKKDLFLKTGIMFLNAAELGQDQWYYRHNISNIINYYNLGIKPLNTKRIDCSISLGLSFRYRNEITFQSSRIVYNSSGESLSMIENNYCKSYDIGGNFELNFIYKINKKIAPTVIIRYMGFNKGSGFYSLNLGVNYTL